MNMTSVVFSSYLVQSILNSLPHILTFKNEQEDYCDLVICTRTKRNVFTWDTERLETEMTTMLTGDRESLKDLHQSVWYMHSWHGILSFSDNMDIRGTVSKKMPLIPTKDLVLNSIKAHPNFAA